MEPRHHFRAALFAGLITLAAVAVLGNQWFYEHVVLKADGPLSRRLGQLASTFDWRFSPKGGQDALWFAKWISAAAVVVGTFLLVWVVAKRATGLPLLFGAWGVTILVAMICGVVRLLIGYGDLFPSGSGGDPDNLGRFWWSVFNGTAGAALWGAIVGFAIGLVAMLFAGVAERVGDRPPEQVFVPAVATDGYGVGAPGTAREVSEERVAYTPTTQQSVVERGRGTGNDVRDDVRERREEARDDVRDRRDDVRDELRDRRDDLPPDPEQLRPPGAGEQPPDPPILI